MSHVGLYDHEKSVPVDDEIRENIVEYGINDAADGAWPFFLSIMHLDPDKITAGERRIVRIRIFEYFEKLYSFLNDPGSLARLAERLRRAGCPTAPVVEDAQRVMALICPPGRDPTGLLTRSIEQLKPELMSVWFGNTEAHRRVVCTPGEQRKAGQQRTMFVNGLKLAKTSVCPIQVNARQFGCAYEIWYLVDMVARVFVRSFENRLADEDEEEDKNGDKDGDGDQDGSENGEVTDLEGEEDGDEEISQIVEA